MPEIKTRKVQKGTIKSLDRAAAMTCRLKDVQTRTKDLVDDPRTRSSRSPDEYASNRITGMAQDAGTDAVYMAEKTATLTAGKIRYALSQAQDGVPESSVRTQGFIRFRKRQLAEKQQIAGRQRSLRIYPGSRERSIRNFANSRQFARAKGKERAIREFGVCKAADRCGFQEEEILAECSRDEKSRQADRKNGAQDGKETS